MDLALQGVPGPREAGGVTGTHCSLSTDGETDVQEACGSQKMVRPRVLAAAIPVSAEFLRLGP